MYSIILYSSNIYFQDIKEQVREDHVNNMFGEVKKDDLGLKYDPQKTIAHVPKVSITSETKEYLGEDNLKGRQERVPSRMVAAKTIEFPGAKDCKTA